MYEWIFTHQHPHISILADFFLSIRILIFDFLRLSICIWQHGFPWPFLTIYPYLPSLLESSHKAGSCNFLLVGHYWYVHTYESIGKCSSLLLQQFPGYLVCLTWMVCVMRNKCPYCCYLVGCCFKDLFKTACSILVWFPFELFLSVSLESSWCCNTIVLTWLQLYQSDQVSIWSITYL